MDVNDTELDRQIEQLETRIRELQGRDYDPLAAGMLNLLGDQLVRLQAMREG